MKAIFKSDADLQKATNDARELSTRHQGLIASSYTMRRVGSGRLISAVVRFDMTFKIQDGDYVFSLHRSFRNGEEIPN